MNVNASRGAVDTGPVQTEAGSPIFTRSGCGSVNDPFCRCPGSEVLSAASPADEITFAVVDAVYSRSTPGWKSSNPGRTAERQRQVGGTAPPTSVVATAVGTG